MINSNNKSKIQDTLEVIRKALEDDKDNMQEDILLLNKTVDDQGIIKTIKINQAPVSENDVENIIDKKINFYTNEWLDKNLGAIITKHLKKNN
tara:strand:- start:289 stop:567 length:279 start_codon:yes stop_codon:yes gene_type:complete